MLPPIAQSRARAYLGREVAGTDLVIIGDTPADIDCGRGVGARALAVATGGFPLDELQSHRPAAAFADLSDTARVMEAILDA
jgi:phosphoglycolate phosphatase-like HAD superfamily hydrolase